MRTLVWIVSALLAMAFLVIGGTKVVTPPADLETMAEGVPVVLLKLAGAAEVLGALGLVLPAVTRILPALTPLAALGLVVTMAGATITNIVISEPALVAQTVVMGALAAFVAWARRGSYAVTPRERTLAPPSWSARVLLPKEDDESHLVSRSASRPIRDGCDHARPRESLIVHSGLRVSRSDDDETS